MASAITALESKRRARPQWMDTVSFWFRPYEHLTQEDARAGKSPAFRYLANAFEVWGLTALLFAAIACLLPGFWRAQIHGGAVLLLITTALIGALVVAPWEWFFHRFAMHRLLAFRRLRWLQVVPDADGPGLVRRFRRMRNSFTIFVTYHVARMAFGHGAHHKITDVTPINPSGLDELYAAISKYEITANYQTDHAVFPHFSLIGFWIFLFPTMVALQLAANALGLIPGLHLPHLPIVLGFMLALTWQIWLYENSHAIMHKPYRSWWKPRINLPIVGRWYSKVYRFHFFHHMNENCSLGVVGAIWFWYVWDRIFGTYKLAREELIENASLITDEVLEMSPEQIRLIPGVRPEDFAEPANKRRWVARMDVQSAKAREIWNELFVQSLQEVRRRRTLQANRA